jgi:hypothetical protein
MNHGSSQRLPYRNQRQPPNSKGAVQFVACPARQLNNTPRIPIFPSSTSPTVRAPSNFNLQGSNARQRVSVSQSRTTACVSQAVKGRGTLCLGTLPRVNASTQLCCTSHTLPAAAGRAKCTQTHRIYVARLDQHFVQVFSPMNLQLKHVVVDCAGAPGKHRCRASAHCTSHIAHRTSHIAH